MDGTSNTSQKDQCSRGEESVPSEPGTSITNSQLDEAESPRSSKVVQVQVQYDNIPRPKRKKLDSDVATEGIPKRRNAGADCDATHALLHGTLSSASSPELWPGADEGNCKATETTALRTRDSESTCARGGPSDDENIRKPKALQIKEVAAGEGRTRKAKKAVKSRSGKQGNGGTADACKPPSLTQNNTTEKSTSAPEPSTVAGATDSDDGDSDGVKIVKTMVSELKNKAKSDPTMVDGWYNWLDELLEHYAKHGHCQVRDAENHILYSWLKRQRIMYRRGKLEPDKLRILQLLKTNGFDTPVDAANGAIPPQAQQHAQSAPISRKTAEARHGVNGHSKASPTQHPRKSTFQGVQGESLDAAATAPPVRGPPSTLVSRTTSQAEESLLHYTSTQPNSEHLATLLQGGGSQWFSFLSGNSPAFQTIAGTGQIPSALDYPYVRLPREDTPGHAVGSNRDRLVPATDHTGSSARSASGAGLLERSLSSLVVTDPLLRLRQPTATRLQNPVNQQSTLQHLLLLQRQQQQYEQQLLLDELFSRQLQGRDGDRPN
jgi:Helicase associated domain